MKTYKMLIDGAWVAASDGQSFDTINPSNGQVWAKVPEATEDDVNRAVMAAHHAFEHGEWARMTATQRGQCLYRLGDLLIDAAEDLGRTETKDTGKMLKETAWQVKYIAQYYHFYAGCADKIQGETLAIDKPDMFVFTQREPLGVIAAVVPWNSQLFLSAVKIAPALAAGNTIVLKTSEYAPAAILEFGELIAKAGIPKGVVNILSGHGDPCGKVLTSHPLIARISFTGGTQSARHVIENSAHNFAEVSLELGGKSPFIVFDDADINSAVNGAVSGIFGASGQSCVAGSRVYLHESIADEFIIKMRDIAASIIIGAPDAEETQMGPLCSFAQLEHIKTQVARAQEQGGVLLHGGKVRDDLGPLYYEPTMIDCPRQDLDIVDTELFGPVVSILRFKDEQQVIALANDTKFGLAAGVFTRNNARAHRMIKAIKAGIVWVNTYRAISPIAEFGGMKHSGYGREAGFQAIYDYTRAKTAWINTSDEPLGNVFVAR